MKKRAALSHGMVILAMLGVLAPLAAWGQPPSNASGPGTNGFVVIPALDVLGLAGLAAAVGGAGLLGLRARRRSRK